MNTRELAAAYVLGELEPARADRGRAPAASPTPSCGRRSRRWAADVDAGELPAEAWPEATATAPAPDAGATPRP